LAFLKVCPLYSYCSVIRNLSLRLIFAGCASLEGCCHIEHLVLRQGSDSATVSLSENAPMSEMFISGATAGQRHMAEKKPEPPKPRGYHSSLDMKLDDALKGYVQIHTDEEQKKFGREQGEDFDALYINHHLKHFQKHGTDEKTKKLKRIGYHDMKDTDKRKWATDYLADLVMYGATKEMGADAAKLITSNHDLLRQYIESHMAAGDLDSFDKIVSYLGDQENLKDAFRTDERIKAIMDNYLGSINSFSKKSRDYRSRISLAQNDKEEHAAVTKFTNSILGKHKKKLTPHAGLDFMLQQIQSSANEAYKPPKKSKFIEDLPDKK
jgi:hypothetical protein